MTKENVTVRVKRCPVCNARYIEEIGEICRCPVEPELGIEDAIDFTTPPRPMEPEHDKPV